MSLSGGRLIAEMLKLQNTQVMFGMGGFQLLPLYEGVRQLGVRHILINDERTGAFAADAYARITGQPGVCDATLGPGATNLTTALAESFNAGVPLIAITGDAHRDFAGRNMTQETTQTQILRSVAKDVVRIENAKRIPELMRYAFSLACTGRPGPVVVDVPEDVSHAELTEEEAALTGNPAPFKTPAFRCRPAAADIERAAELLASAKRPVILAGGGIHISQACDALQSLAESHDIPVAHTLSGKGAIACTHPLSLGLFGRYDRIANDFIAKSDGVLVVGCKLGEIATKRYSLPGPGIPMIHLDIEPVEIGRWRPADVALFGDARCGLEDIYDALDKKSIRKEYLAEVVAEHKKWRTDAQDRYQSSERPINVGRIMGELNAHWPEDGILVADGGFASHWTGLLYDTKRNGRGFVAGRGMASIGYGLPGSLGCKLAAPDRPVIGLTGDGGFNMAVGDLETARRASAGFALIVINNAASGYVKALQHAVYGEGNYQSSDLSELDYADVAKAYGCDGIRVEDPSELAAAIKLAAKPRDIPLVIDVVVTRDPGKMLPAADSRTLTVEKGDRPV
ncbi:MAG: thiamine pyrophosphate-binding protein [Rhodospirillaceae bacterium]